jgi:hypothetical protein
MAARPWPGAGRRNDILLPVSCCGGKRFRIEAVSHSYQDGVAMPNRSAKPSPTPADVAARTGAIALAVGAIAAPFGTAHATIVVNDIEQPLSGPALLDLFSITQFVAGTSTSITGSGTNLIYTGGGAKAVKLSAGDVIGPSLFTDSNGSGTASLGFPKGPYFIGLDVNSGVGIDNYGYAEFGFPSDIIMYAFQTTENTPIAIPGVAVPEPGSLSLLAMGVAGALAVRRRAKRDRAEQDIRA